MIYAKTERGQNAIKDRASGLTPKQRSVLIMCDGKKESELILKNTAALGVTASDLDILVSLQLIVGINPTIVQTAPRPTTSSIVNPPAVSNPAAVASGSRSVTPEELTILIRRATKQLESLLGPSCESMSLKLEKSKNYDEFAIKIHDIRRVLVTIRSEKVADEFLGFALS